MPAPNCRNLYLKKQQPASIGRNAVKFASKMEIISFLQQQNEAERHSYINIVSRDHTNGDRFETVAVEWHIHKYPKIFALISCWLLHNKDENELDCESFYWEFLLRNNFWLNQIKTVVE